MRKIRYFITEEVDTTTGELEVSDQATVDEINELVLAEVATTVTSNKWTADWEYM
jgi:hypothetical protein